MSSTLRKLQYNRPDGPQCSICLKRFSKNQALRQHIERVHEKAAKAWQCAQCHKEFSQKSHLTTHIRTVHEKEKRHQCRFCSKRFGEAGNRDRHVRMVHLKQRSAECFHCQKTFCDDKALLAHTEQIHLGQHRRSYKCPRCDYVSHGSPAHVKIHFLARHTDHRFRCAFGCAKSYSAVSDLGKNHLKKNHKIAHDYIKYAVLGKQRAAQEAPRIRSFTVRCRICRRKYANKNMLKLHLLNAHV